MRGRAAGLVERVRDLSAASVACVGRRPSTRCCCCIAGPGASSPSISAPKWRGVGNHSLTAGLQRVELARERPQAEHVDQECRAATSVVTTPSVGWKRPSADRLHPSALHGDVGPPVEGSGVGSRSVNVIDGSTSARRCECLHERSRARYLRVSSMSGLEGHRAVGSLRRSRASSRSPCRRSRWPAWPTRPTRRRRSTGTSRHGSRSGRRQLDRERCGARSGLPRAPVGHRPMRRSP